MATGRGHSKGKGPGAGVTLACVCEMFWSGRRKHGNNHWQRKSERRPIFLVLVPVDWDPFKRT